MDFEKVPPSDPEIERRLLGTAIHNGVESFSVMAALLKPEYLYVPEHLVLWAIMDEVVSSGSELSIVTVCDAVRKQNQLTSVGGEVYVAGLVDGYYYASDISIENSISELRNY